MPKLTPAMQQYADMKASHPDCILFFRLGDFYEMFRQDAKTAATLLDLTLTSKNKNAPNPIPMAGIPHHSAEKYIEKLVSLGHKVAIAEQTSTPTPGKLVEREVVSIITPGTHIAHQQQKHNYMLAITHTASAKSNPDTYHIARGDFSDGYYYTQSFSTRQQCITHIAIIQPTEIIHVPEFSDQLTIHNIHTAIGHSTILSLHDIPHDPQTFLQNILNVQTLDGYGKTLHEGRRETLALLLHYINHTQSTTTHINDISYHHQQDDVLMDDTTIRNLELFVSSYDNSPSHSLFGIVNQTQTAMGARLLSKRLTQPTQNTEKINTRLEHIQSYLPTSGTQESDTTHITHTLKQLSDLPKLLATIIYRKPRATLLGKLKNNLDIILGPQTQEAGSLRSDAEQKQKANITTQLISLGLSTTQLNSITSFHQTLSSTLQADITDNHINFIQDNVSPTIDQLRKTAYHSDQLILAYQQELVQKSGITNIKIKYITNQGYYIEITPNAIAQFEKNITTHTTSTSHDNRFELIRRQTLKSAQRYSSPYLASLETDILQAKQKLIHEEQLWLQKLITQLTSNYKDFSHLSDIIAHLDIYTSHALFATQHHRCKPTLIQSSKPSGETQHTTIIAGRHPVIEHYLPHDQSFITNDLSIASTQTNTKTSNKQHGFIHILTGPNMGGKSTFLRQNALIVLLAHCGLYVPATQATIAVVDALFARVGSGDALSKNQSTFMTEMIEVSNIIHNSSNRSFIVFDELGRGTATFDGLALTQAIVEFIAHKTQSQTLLATHYHELTTLESNIPGIVNYAVDVHETEDDIIFLKKVIKGKANKSYGIEVAKLAGLPQQIITDAHHHLQQLEKQQSETPQQQHTNHPTTTVTTPKATHPLLESLTKHNLNETTPLQALHILTEIQQKYQQNTHTN